MVCSFPGKRRGAHIAGGRAPHGRSRGCNPAWAGSLTIAGSQLTAHKARRGEEKTKQRRGERDRDTERSLVRWLAAHCWQQTLGLLCPVHPPSPFPSSHSALAPRHPFLPSDAPTTQATAHPAPRPTQPRTHSIPTNKRIRMELPGARGINSDSQGSSPSL